MQAIRAVFSKLVFTAGILVFIFAAIIGNISIPQILAGSILCGIGLIVHSVTKIIDKTPMWKFWT